MTLLEVKKKEIYSALERYQGNKTKAAEHLEMSLRSLRDLTNRDPMFHRFRSDDSSGFTSVPQFKEKRMTTEIAEKPLPEVFDTKEVVQTLNGLMKKVTATDCTAETVNAACNCASQITQLLRVHLDVERLKRKFT